MKKEIDKINKKEIRESTRELLEESGKESYSLGEERQAEQILKEGDPLKFLIETVAKIHVGDRPIIAKLILSGLSSGFGNRKLTIHSKEVGSYSKGKSAVHEAVSMIFSKVDRITSSSAKAKFYKAAAGKLYDKGIMIFDEAEGSQEAIVLERALTDDKLNPPTHETVTKDREFASLKVNEINSVWKNCATLDADDQLNSRYLISNVDETPAQDRAVYNKILDSFSKFDFANKDLPEFRVARLVTQKIKEEPIKILIPYKNSIRASNVENRRSLPKFLRLLYAVVYCYRFQRPKIEGYVIATKKDFEVAALIWNKAIQELELTRLDRKHNELLEQLPTREEEAISRQELAKKLGLSISTVYSRLKTLLDVGRVSYKEERETTKKKLYWRVGECRGVSFKIDTLDVDDITSFFRETVGLSEEQIKSNSFRKILAEIVNSSIPSTLRQSIISESKFEELAPKTVKIGEKRTVRNELTVLDSPQQSYTEIFTCASCKKKMKYSEINQYMGLVYCKDCFKKKIKNKLKI